jgi:hypothetical protein
MFGARGAVTRERLACDAGVTQQGDFRARAPSGMASVPRRASPVGRPPSVDARDARGLASSRCQAHAMRRRAGHRPGPSMRARSPFSSFVGLSVVALAASGCNPMLYTMHVGAAAHSVEEARLADAADLAPYEFYLAEAYLEKAREEAARGHYQDARRFASIAEEHGVKGRDLARRHMRESGR